MKTYEIILSGSHDDITVIIETEDDISKNELLQKAIDEAMKKTYIWQIKEL